MPRAAAQQEGGTPALRVARQVLTVLEADRESRTLAVLERVELVNESDTPFVPSTAGSQGPMGLLRFALPRGAFDLTVDQRLSAYDVIQVDRGFGSLLPVPPGATDVTFSYRVPYARGEHELNTTAVYPTASFWMLLPADVSAASAELRQHEVVEIGRQRYQVLVGQGLAAGQRVSVMLGGLPFNPRPWPLEETVQRGAALALALLGVLAAWAYAQYRGRAPAGYVARGGGS